MTARSEVPTAGVGLAAELDAVAAYLERHGDLPTTAVTVRRIARQVATLEGGACFATSNEAPAPADAGEVDPMREVHAALHAMAQRVVLREPYPDEYDRVIAAVMAVEMAAAGRADAELMEASEREGRANWRAIHAEREVAALRERCDRLEGAVQYAEHVFMAYVELHTAKGTVSGYDKAATNQRHLARMRRATVRVAETEGGGQ